MPVRGAPLMPADVSQASIAVDKVEQGVISGRLYHKYKNECYDFVDMQQAYAYLENWFDSTAYPQSTYELRGFESTEKKENITSVGDVASLLAVASEPTNQVAGQIATFELIVVARRSCSWQGMVSEQNTTNRFSFASQDQLTLYFAYMLEKYFQESIFYHWQKNQGEQAMSLSQEQLEKSLLQENRNTKNSFVVQVEYHENSSLQGVVSWLEGQETVPFRSSMELIYLMNSTENPQQQEDISTEEQKKKPKS